MKITRPGLTMMLTLLPSVVVGPVGCAPRVAPAPATVRRIAVLPPCDATGAPLSPTAPAGLYAGPESESRRSAGIGGAEPDRSSWLRSRRSATGGDGDE